MLSSVIQDVKLQDAGSVGPFPGPPAPNLIPSKKYPDPRYVACLISKHPFFPHCHPVKPYGKIHMENEEYLDIEVYKISRQQFEEYIDISLDAPTEENPLSETPPTDDNNNSFALTSSR